MRFSFIITEIASDIKISKLRKRTPTAGSISTKGSVRSEMTKEVPWPHMSRNPFVTASSYGNPNSAEKPMLRGIIGIVHVDSRTMFMKMSPFLSILKVSVARIIMIRLPAIKHLAVRRYLWYFASKTPTINEVITPKKVMQKPIALISDDWKPRGLKNRSILVPKEVKTPCIRLYMTTSFR